MSIKMLEGLVRTTYDQQCVGLFLLDQTTNTLNQWLNVTFQHNKFKTLIKILKGCKPYIKSNKKNWT